MFFRFTVKQLCLKQDHTSPLTLSSVHLKILSLVDFQYPRKTHIPQRLHTFFCFQKPFDFFEILKPLKSLNCLSSSMTSLLAGDPSSTPSYPAGDLPYPTP
ncbi:hypothetical protein HanIR_Chr15g0751021 [Helianthus annuus]|nr:hypothetical protein HanIR_Chr15g0751021 [Helianthus annuus]